MAEVNDECSYFPNEIFFLGWCRWMPTNAFFLYGVVGTATVHEIDGSLEELISNSPAVVRYPQGEDTPLRWFDDADEDEDDPEEDEEPDGVTVFNDAVAHIAPPPETIGDYARILAGLGVFHHTQDGPHERWRVATPMPLPTEVLRLPSSVAKKEDSLRWRYFVAEEYVQKIRHTMKDEQKSRFDTSIERFARHCDLDPEACRQGLMVLAEDGEVVMTRRGSPVDVERLPEHSRISIEPQRDVIAENSITIHRSHG